MLVAHREERSRASGRETVVLVQELDPHPLGDVHPDVA